MRIDTSNPRFWAVAALTLAVLFLVPGGALFWHALKSTMPGWVGLPGVVLLAAGSFGLAWTLEEFEHARTERG